MASFQCLPVDSQSAVVLAEFEKKFGYKPKAVACGPGRVNLIGEHTDYQAGHVFPMALDMKCCAAGSFNSSGKFRFFSMNLNDMAEFSVFPQKPGSNHEWWNYAVGAMAVFYDFTKLTLPQGCDVCINSTVPLGGGVSSSAALEVAMATLMECLTGHYISPLEKAETVCQQAEHKWAGVGCGLMDQAISVMGKADHAMLFDCKYKKCIYADLPSSLKVVVVDSGIRHKLVDGEYGKRKASCVEAVTAIQKRHPEVEWLRDAKIEWLEEAKAEVSEVTYRRGKHVIDECTRCMTFAEQLNAGKFKEAGQTMYEGHWSLSKDYETSIPQIDEMVHMAEKLDGVYGVRITGGGFGGCVVILCEADKADKIKDSVLASYTKYFNEKGKANAHSYQQFAEPKSYIVVASEGAHCHKL